MLPLTAGQYTARIARTALDIDRALALRHLCFIANRGLVTNASDADAYDDICQHILVEQSSSGNLVSCFRVMGFSSGATIGASYSAQFYDLTLLSHYAQPMLELGRFCIHPDHPNADVLRLAWAALTDIVDSRAVGMLVGCTSFQGTDPLRYDHAFALLNAAHLAPDALRPGVKSAQAYPFSRALQGDKLDQKRALMTLPPLLRTYLAMGGWVSDHAVIDSALDTLHVFTGLEIDAIPAARARLLRSLAS